jgi:hypothetical protein
MKLYEYAVVYNPKPPQNMTLAIVTTPTEPAVIVVPPTCVLARDEKHAAMLAARAIPESYAGKLDEVDVAVRPF